MHEFWLSFVPLFVAVDPLGILPMFIGLTNGIERKKKRRIIAQSVATAMVVALLFLFIGKAVFSLLGITVADFMIAGGLLLFALSLTDLLRVEKVQRSVDPESVGVVPLGVPLVVGPAVLTTMILLVNEYGVLPTVLATVANISIAGLVFLLSEPIIGLLGDSGARAISKLSSLILAAIGVMMVRRGIDLFLLPPGSG